MKFLSALFVLFLIVGCNKPVNANPTEVVTLNDTLSVSKKDISKIKYVEFEIDSKAKKVFNNWRAYGDIANAIAGLKEGDFIFFTENKIFFSTALEDLESTMPNEIDTAPIKARVLVLSTKLYKMEEIMNLNTSEKKDRLIVIKEVLEAYSNFIFQVNKKFEKDAQKIVKPE